MNYKKKALWTNLVIASGIALLSACGGSSSSLTSSTTTITGSTFAAPVSGATVAIKDTSGNTIAGPVTTNGSGQYSVTIPNANLSQALIFESTGGTFADEATGNSTTAGTMTAYAAGGSLSAGAEMHATPGSTIVAQMITQHSMTQTQAENAFQTAFGYTPDTSLAPTDATNPGSGATTTQKLAGLRAATFSQLANDLGLQAQEQFQLMLALAQDLSDGTLDGVDGSGAITVSGTAVTLQAQIQNQFTVALDNFHGGSNDATGLTVAEIGSLPFAKIAKSASYQFEYVPGMMSAMEGKTMFKIKVTDAATGLNAQAGLNLDLSATMYMATKTHMTPVPANDCTESATPGTYDCVLFYLMPSTMSGMSMGYWQLKVTDSASSENVSFYPSVGMGMNGNGKHKLMAMTTGTNGDGANVYDDYVMMMTSARPYFLFKNMISGSTGNHTVSLYAAVQEGMMSFPALYAGQTYNLGEVYELTAGTVDIEFSTDKSTWTAMSHDGNGYWSLGSVTGLTDGVENTFYVRLKVNSLLKTTTGAVSNEGGCEAPDVPDNGVPLCNSYTTFTLTL